MDKLWPETSESELASVRDSGLFDAQWYLAQYPDVAILQMDPCAHYLRYGAMMGRDPSPQFSTGFYLATHPAARKKQINPLVDYLAGPAAADPGRILWAAMEDGHRLGDFTRGIDLARRFLPQELAHTLPVLEANHALSAGDTAGWLAHVNRYLGHFNLSPLALSGQGALLNQLKATAPTAPDGGPLISVIMAAWNAEETVQAAAHSILDQSWKNLELLIVDDASSDGTWAALQQLERSDGRVKIMRNARNVGPYVSKNFALTQAQGAWITGQDADDWSHPQRLENHMTQVLGSDGALRASLGRMVRMKPDGMIGVMPQSSYCSDGVARKASISCLYEKQLLDAELGFWDSVRAGADSEMISRAQMLLGEGFQVLEQITMLCLDVEGSLTNHAVMGAKKGRDIPNHPRTQYRDAWLGWHESGPLPADLYIPFPQHSRPYPCPEAMDVCVAFQKYDLMES